MFQKKLLWVAEVMSSEPRECRSAFLQKRALSYPIPSCETYVLSVLLGDTIVSHSAHKSLSFLLIPNFQNASLLLHLHIPAVLQHTNMKLSSALFTVLAALGAASPIAELETRCLPFCSEKNALLYRIHLRCKFLCA
jgi:hypothetical protein